ncbi:MAG TPA: hypothetical protein VHP58_05885 [Alphaproteobacteria bacterium]|nr:hypothetical protein [Alphaproteobacteria bacterium]
MQIFLTLLGYVHSAIYSIRIDVQLIVMTLVIALLLWGVKRFRQRNARSLRREWAEALQQEIAAGRLPPRVLESPQAELPALLEKHDIPGDSRERAVLVCEQLERLRAPRRLLSLAA